MGETERGCGFRKIGGVYLVCEGGSLPCDALPVEMGPCECCDFTVNQARSMQPIHAGYLAALLKGHVCHDPFACPICWYATKYPELKAEIGRLRARLAIPWENKTAEMREGDADVVEALKDLEAKFPKVFYLMFVSKEFYTPESFVKEARKQGISKRVAANSLPKGFVVGKDWVFLAHGETPIYKAGAINEVRKATAIFYAFKPERLELVLWKGTDNQLIRDYEDAGYTVVLLEKTKANIERHGDGAYPPLPTGFKRKDKKPLPERTFANRGSRNRGLYNEAGDAIEKGKPPKKVVSVPMTADGEVPADPATRPETLAEHIEKHNPTAPKKTAKTAVAKPKKKSEADAEDSEAPAPTEESQWTKGEL